MKLIKSLLSLALIATIFVSCSKEGPAGPAGESGIDGNPAVFYSDWLPTGTVNPGYLDGNSGNSFTITAPKLTEDILNKGAVLVYFQINPIVTADLTCLSLPYITGAGGGANTIAFYPRLGEIKILRFKNDGINGATNLGSTWNWRYIIIPGGTKVARKSEPAVNFNTMSYLEVCSYFHINP